VLGTGLDRAKCPACLVFVRRSAHKRVFRLCAAGMGGGPEVGALGLSWRSCGGFPRASGGSQGPWIEARPKRSGPERGFFAEFRGFGERSGLRPLLEGWFGPTESPAALPEGQRRPTEGRDRLHEGQRGGMEDLRTFPESWRGVVEGLRAFPKGPRGLVESPNALPIGLAPFPEGSGGPTEGPSPRPGAVDHHPPHGEERSDSPTDPRREPPA
jgi:hypothetical protein